MKGGSRGKKLTYIAGGLGGAVIGGAAGVGKSVWAGGNLGQDIAIGATIGAAAGAKAASNLIANQGSIIHAEIAILSETCPPNSPVLKGGLRRDYVGELNLKHLDSLFLKKNGDRASCPYNRNQFIKLMDQLIMRINPSEHLRGIFPYTRTELKNQIISGRKWGGPTGSQDKTSGKHQHYMTKKEDDSLWAKYIKGGIKISQLISDSSHTVPEMDHRAYITHRFVILNPLNSGNLDISRLVYFNGYGEDGQTMGYVEFIPSDYLVPSDSLHQIDHTLPNLSLWKISRDFAFKIPENVEVKPLVVEVSLEQQRKDIMKELSKASDADDMDKVYELDQQLKALLEKDSGGELVTGT
jgi:hypothetical protein